MFAWQATVQDEFGNAVLLPVVTVYIEDGLTLASIYDEDGDPLPNPLTGTLEGFVQFWAESGTYKVIGADGPAKTSEWSVFLDTPLQDAISIAESAASEAATSAAAALASKNDAETSASTASTKASEATSAATVATTKASEATAAAASVANLALDPYFEIADRYPTVSRSAAPAGYPGPFMLSSDVSKSAYFETVKTPISENKTYLLETYLRKDDPANGSRLFAGVRFWDAAGNKVFDAKGWPSSNLALSNHYFPSSSHVPTTTLTRHTLTIGPQGSAVIPVGAVYMSFAVYFNYSAVSPSRHEVAALRISEVDAGIPGGFKPWMRQKHLLSADWQPIDAPQVTRLRATLDAIALKHPDLTHAHMLGDLVDTATVNSTGAAPLYGFPEFLADWRARLPIPLGRAFFLPGNHDLDGFGTGSHRFAWSLATYRRWMGREYYSTLQGNLLNIYLGDMGGSNGGEITDAVMNWAVSLIRNNADKNIIINLHQPLNNTYASETEATQAALFITNSARLTSVLSTVTNVAAVFYGHVGSENQFFDRTLYNTRHIQIGMHLPGNVLYSRDDHYYTMDFKHGSSNFAVTQHNATTGVTGATKTITLAFPLQLGEDYTHDGRDDEMEGPRVSPLVVRVPVDAVTNLTAPYAPDTSKVHWVGDFGMNDRSNHDMPAGFKVGIGISYPGAAKVSNPGDDGDSYFVTSGENATVGMYAVSRGGADPTSGIELTFVTGNEGVGDDTMTLYPQYLSDLRGIYTPHHVRVGGALAGVEDHGVTTRTGVSLSDTGRIFASTTASLTVMSLQRASATDGYFATFRRGTTMIGSINSAGSTTSFNTTSDKRLKSDWQEFDGLATVMALEVWDHAWIEHDHRSKGVLAQDAALVAPYAVSEGDDETPWAVDYSKFVPDLIRAVQQLSARVEELEGQSNGK